MKSSKKIDIAYVKKEPPLMVSIIRGGRSFYCSYGQIKETKYMMINSQNEDLEEGATVSDIDTLKSKEELKITEDPEANIFPYESGKYIVVTISFIFDRWTDGEIAQGPLGVAKTKINLRDKGQIISATFTDEDVKDKAYKADVDVEFLNLCDPIFYDVDLLIYGDGLQYFKGNIEYSVSYFEQRKTLDTELSLIILQPPLEGEECINPRTRYEESTGIKLESLNPLIYHINFNGTKR
jgi:hypothetical protein